MCIRDCVQDSSILWNVRFYVFISDKGSIIVGELNDNWCFNFSSGFQYGVDGVSIDVVYCWQCEVVFFCYLENFLYVIISDYVRFYEIKNFRYVFCFVLLGFIFVIF